jgi:DnaJ-class molecular chaperone
MRSRTNSIRLPKAALKHHPDKHCQTGSEIKLNLFCKISNAYEILSIPPSGTEYDYGAQQQRAFGGSHQPLGPSRRELCRVLSFDFSSVPSLHDPIQIFEQVFREEFGDGGNLGRSKATPTSNPSNA